MIAIIGVIALIGAILLGLALQKRYKLIRSIAQGLILTYVVIVGALALGELYFRYIHIDTEGRLASYRWMEYHWRENQYGYRDREWTAEDLTGQQTIYILGDSFTEGWGIENPDDRFSAVLAQDLGDDYAVVNLGSSGSSTPEQQVFLEEAVERLGTPDTVILQYFLNDIEYSALSVGMGVHIPEPPPLFRESYLLNWLYARFSAGFPSDYWQWQYDTYDNFGIWQIHERELNAFADYVDALDARLIVVIFPNLQDPVRSIPYVDRVAQAFESRENPPDILKLFDAAAALPVEDVVVSPRDGHPSVMFHHLVGDMIYELFFEQSPS